VEPWFPLDFGLTAAAERRTRSAGAIISRRRPNIYRRRFADGRAALRILLAWV
jgi:hypothetical protein